MRSLPIVGCCAGAGVHGKTGSQPFTSASMWVFFFLFTQLLEIAQLVFGFSSEEIVPYVAADLVSMGGGEFSIFLCRHPELEPYVVFFEWSVKREEEELEKKARCTLKVNITCAHFVKSVTFLGRKFENHQRF